MTLTDAQEARLLVRVACMVPAADRAEWTRFWHAELWCHRHAAPPPTASDLYGGLVRDALWIRLESSRCALRGTASQCLLTLLLFCSLALLLATCSIGTVHQVLAQLAGEYGRFVLATPLVLLVTFFTAPRRAVHANAPGRPLVPQRAALVRGAFFMGKASALFVLAYLLSASVCASLAVPLPNTADFIRILLYVVLSVFALRWSFEDQERRCKHCLRLLNSPARVGRPSHNLLEWSGTALVCVRGHGVLSIPELETSWCQTSEWTQDIVGTFPPTTGQLA